MAKKKPLPLLGPLELEVMKVIWDLGDASVAEVLERVQSEKELHHNTVMTVMKRLADKGYLEQYARDGRTKGYQPRISREEVGSRYVELVRDQFFDGSTSDAIAAFLGNDSVSQSQITKLRRLLGGR